ncbi:MAG: hypothetical protein DRR16_17885 [Candidatus Parabeggiatoa sp. nov. 3]|nr:MAG: hypothetical protein DRR00_13205 [Gammaproteobacteria bacterium]RKZ61554.1 MAG: hypothetical protein DRQ99_20250 [Gammaproteobacteria bacterium]RKZ83199.1 MAG: hypothetical protein DRR16_17885 [Gammaproteobacteria bacterium]
MQTFTLFTIPQAFENQYDLMQWNAIKSWTLLNPKPDIFLLGNAPGIASITNELGLYHIPNIDQKSSISDIAKWLDRLVNNTILVYINPSVILTEDFAITIQDVYNNQDHFFLTGQYRTVQTEGAIDFNDNQWQHQLRVMADKQSLPQGQLQDVYLVFTKQLLKQLFVSCEMRDATGNYIQDGYNWPVFSREKLIGAMIVHHSRMFRKRDWLRTTGFNEPLKNAVDFDMFLKLSEVCTIHHLDQIMYAYRWHGENTSIVHKTAQFENHVQVIWLALERLGLDKDWEVYSPDKENIRKVAFRQKNKVG